ncbi:hypothetical protein D9M68_387650 [compost metagenome]
MATTAPSGVIATNAAWDTPAAFPSVSSAFARTLSAIRCSCGDSVVRTVVEPGDAPAISLACGEIQSANQLPERGVGVVGWSVAKLALTCAASGAVILPLATIVSRTTDVRWRAPSKLSIGFHWLGARNKPASIADSGRLSAPMSLLK